MAGVRNADLVDLIATTLPDLPEQYFEVTWTNNNYEACRIYQQDRMEVDGGTSIKRKLMLSNNGNARYRRAFDVDAPAIGDVMKEIDVPWCQIGTHYSWDKIEILRNKNSAKGFIRLLETRRIDGLWSLADLIEERFWKAPDSATDDLNPYGVPYYLNMLDGGATTAGFNASQIRFAGGTTSRICAGLDASAAGNENWKSYAAVYTRIDNAFLKICRTAFLATGFKAPYMINDPAQPRNAAKRFYADLDTTVSLQELADAKDDNHRGKDVLGNIKMDDGGLVYINRLPVVYVNQLNGVVDPVKETATSPVYCLDFEKFIPYVQDGYWMEEGDPMDGGIAQHTVFTVFLDGSHNNLCTNRKGAGFVIHKPIAV